MDKLMNASNAPFNKRNEVKIELENKMTSRLTVDMLEGLFNPIELYGTESELFTNRDEYLWSRDVSKNFVHVIINHIADLFDKFSKITFVEHYTSNERENSITTIILLDNKHTKLCEIGDYTDTWQDNWSREDHDKFEIHGDYVFVNKRKTSIVKSDWSDNNQTVEVTVIKSNDRVYDGLSEIPKDSTLLPNAVYRDITIKRDVNFNNGIEIFNVAGKVTINSETPLKCSGGIVKIKGEDGSVLTLISGEQQPCIGPWTRTGMSYGRWSPEGTSPKEIIIDNCTVICESKVDSFSLGCYGTNDIPKITLLNGGKLICPETSGNRVILKQTVPPGGSTKISEPMVYGIMKKEDSIFDVVPAEVRTSFAELVYKYIEYKDSLYTTTTVKDIEEAFNILSTNPNVDITLLLKSNAKMYIKRCALLLRMPDEEELVKLDEFRFDAIKKAEFINKLVYNSEDVDQLEAAVNLIYFLKTNTYATPNWNFMKEVCYEIIPSYLYDFGEHREYTHEEHVEAFIEENRHLIQDKCNDMISHDVIDYFLWNKHII